MAIFVVCFLALFVTITEGYVDIKTPRDDPYTSQNVIFYYLTGNYTVGIQQKFGKFEILEMDLNRDAWMLLYTKPQANTLPQPPCNDNVENIPQERIMKIYNNHTVKGSSDVPDKWTIENNTVVCFQILQRASVDKWGYFRYKYEDTCSKLVVTETRPLASSSSKSITVKRHQRCYSLKPGHSTVIDFQMTLHNSTAMTRAAVTKQSTYDKMECKTVQKYNSYYGSYRSEQECSNVKKIKSEFLLMVTGQTPANFLLKQWPLVVTNLTNVCFEFDVVGAREFKDDMLFRVSEFPQCHGLVSNRSGIVVSPGYPTTPYPNNTDCLWTLKVRPGEKILVKFGDTVSDCGNDYLMLSGVEGGSNNQELLCGGSVTGRSFMTKANELTVRFQTRNFRNLKGFLMNYTVIGCSLQGLSFPVNSVMLNRPKAFIPPGYGLRIGCKPGFVFPSKAAEYKLECMPDSTWYGTIPYCIGYTVCNETLKRSAGHITSPGYPHPYPKDASCSWTIIAKTGQRIIIKVQDIKSSCLNDYIVIDGVEQKVNSATTTTTTMAPTTTTTAAVRQMTQRSRRSLAFVGLQNVVAKPGSKSSTPSHKEYICGDSVKAGKEYTSDGNSLVIRFRSNIFQETGYFNFSYTAVGCSGDDLRMPLNALLRNPDTYYPVGYRLVVGCANDFSFPGGTNSVVLTCNKLGSWFGKIPFCVRWRSGL